MLPAAAAKFVRRIGVAACAAIFILYPLGYWWSASLFVPRRGDMITLYVDAGQVRFNVVPDWISGVSGPKHWEWRLARTYPKPHLSWRPFARWGSGAAMIDIPLHVPLTLIGVPTLMLRRRDSRPHAAAAICRSCGYDRAG